MTSLLDSINSPKDIKSYSPEQLDALVDELRTRIIETVSKNGGHLSSPLGVVELTVALHRVFDMPEDKLIWDVGHQCYAHKLLTGRAAKFDGLRKRNGISGYPRRSESIYDSFGTGHSSTSISAAVGMAIARDHLGLKNHVVSLIGDGAMTGGMAFEALNHAGNLDLDMLVILNDNEMSISRNVGALARYFNRMITAAPYKRAKQDVGSDVKSLIGDRMTRTIQDIEKSVKGFITKGSLFQDYGFNYIGPIDGHDLPLLIEVLTRLKQMKGPVLLHCTTEKGKGLKAAEEDPQAYHGVKPFSLEDAGEGDPVPKKSNGALAPVKAITFTDAFAKALLEEAEKNTRIVAITAAMPTGTGLSLFEESFPDRFFDVGICEQHAVTFAAGLATEGIKPVVAIYSTFLQRGYDQVIHDVCLQGLPVIFAIDRAGLVGEDSPTQNGAFDLSFLRATPNLHILVPRDGVDMALMLKWAVAQNLPVALRYAKDNAPPIGNIEGRDVSCAETLREGDDMVFLTVGPCAAAALEAAERLAQDGYAAAVVDARTVKPLDTALLNALHNKPIITVEENALAGGFGSAVLEYYERTGQLQGLDLCRMGLDDIFYEQASRKEQLALCKLDADGLYACASQILANVQSVFAK